MAFYMEPIGYVRGGRKGLEDDAWGAVESHIDLNALYLNETATNGLQDFSHLVVVFVFDQLDPEQIVRGARHPRGRADWPKVGILAQRGSPRPNRIGVTTCQILSVQGHQITVRGLDAVDGSPILDIKPYMSGFAPRDKIREPNWAVEIMDTYW